MQLINLLWYKSNVNNYPNGMLSYKTLGHEATLQAFSLRFVFFPNLLSITKFFIKAKRKMQDRKLQSSFAK